MTRIIYPLALFFVLLSARGIGQINQSTFDGLNIQQRENPLRSHDVKQFEQSHAFDSIEALQKFLAEFTDSEQNGWTLLSLKKGKYTFEPKQAKIFSLKNMSNVVLDFNNSEITFTKPAGMVQVAKSKQVIIRNLTFDIDPVPFTQGFVEKVNTDQKEVTVRLKEGWKMPGANYRRMGKNWVVVKDPDVVGKQKRGCMNVYTIDKNWVEIDENTYRVKFVSGIANIEKGDKIVHLGPGGGNCFIITDSYQVTVENITQYAGGVFMGAQRADATNILNSSVRIKPGTDRWHSNTRDIFIERDARIGPWIEGCFFEANGDDGINLHTKGFKVVERVSDHALLIAPEINQFNRPNPIYLAEGDSVLFFDNKLGMQQFTGKVEKLEAKEKGAYVVSFDKALPEFPDADEKYPNIDSRYEGWNTSVNCPGYVIRNNTFKHQRRFGLLLLSKNGIIEQNKFIGISANAIYMGFLEEHSDIGQMCGNVVIRKNLFDDCFVQHKRPNMKLQASAINITLPKRPDKSFSPHTFFRNVSISENEFINFHDKFPVVRLFNTSATTFSGNVFKNCISQEQMIETHSSNVTMRNNRFK